MKLFKRLKQETKVEHKAFGGMIFLLVSFMSGVTMLYTVSLSWNSNAVAMADNIAYITTVNTANQLYLSNVDSFEFKGTQQPIVLRNGKTINPMGQYSKMLQSSKLIKQGTPSPTVYNAKWDKRKGTLAMQFDGFTTTVGSFVVPHNQESVIEDN